MGRSKSETVYVCMNTKELELTLVSSGMMQILWYLPSMTQRLIFPAAWSASQALMRCLQMGRYVPFQWGCGEVSHSLCTLDYTQVASANTLHLPSAASHLYCPEAAAQDEVQCDPCHRFCLDLWQLPDPNACPQNFPLELGHLSVPTAESE